MLYCTNLTARKINFTIFKKLFKKMFHKNFELSLVFATPILMRGLNKKYKNKNNAASVLSFLLEKGCKGKGEILLNTEEKKLPELFVHGCLHLFGYDHKTKKDYNLMSKKGGEMLKF